MNSKIELIDELIEKSNECIEKNDTVTAGKLLSEIRNIFLADIKYLDYGLRDEGKNVFDKLYLLVLKLRNLKGSLESEYEKTKLDQSVIVNQTQNQVSTITIQMTFEQTISAIEALPDETLSQDDKELLEGKLTKINTEKNKSKLWEKAQSALKWIAEKGFEVGIAALPYIVEVLKNAK